MTALNAQTNRERPVLVFGAPRSGTSLLSRLLDAHSAIRIPFESHLFNQWMGRAHRYGDLERPNCRRRLIEDITTFGVVRDWTRLPDTEAIMERVETNDFAGIARAFLQWSADDAQKRRWGEKTPHHTLLHRDVLTAWPDAVVIIIQRDPRDVVLSWKRARFGGNHVLPFAKAWVKYMRACDEVRAAMPPERRMSITYEALVRDPKAQLTQIMRFLGEEYEAAQLGFHESEEGWNTDKRNRTQLSQPISDSSIGQWQQGLTPREIALVESIAGAKMAPHGYAPSLAGRDASKLDFFRAQWIEYPLQRVWGLPGNAQGFRYLWRDISWRLNMLMRPAHMGRQTSP
jgi:hypothetical protein